MKLTILPVLSLLFTSLFVSTLSAEIRYIDDTLRVPLRSGASTQHRIITFMMSGTKVDQQKVNEEDPNWAYVILDDEKEGWVQIRYLKNTPAAKQLLAYSQQQLEKEKKTNKEQRQTINELRSELNTLKSEHAKLKKHSEATDKELAHIKEISENAIRLDHSNSELLEQNEILKITQEENKQLINKLESNQQNTGMIYGALAVLLGVILGWVMPKMRSNKSDGWI